MERNTSPAAASMAYLACDLRADESLREYGRRLTRAERRSKRPRLSLTPANVIAYMRESEGV